MAPKTTPTTINNLARLKISSLPNESEISLNAKYILATKIRLDKPDNPLLANFRFDDALFVFPIKASGIQPTKK